MRLSHVLVTVAALSIPQRATADEADRSTPEAAFHSLYASNRDGNLDAIAEALTADSQEQLAVALLIRLMNVRERLTAGPPSGDADVAEIDRFLAEQGLSPTEWVLAAMTASNRRQSSEVLLMAMAIQNVKHWPRFVAGAQQVLFRISEDDQFVAPAPADGDNPWKKLKLVNVVIDGEEAQLTVASETTDAEKSLTFRKVGEEWLYVRLYPLPPEIQEIVHVSAETVVEPPSSGIEVNAATTSTPQAVYQLAKAALEKEDCRAFAKCLTADSLEANAAIMLMQTLVVLRKDELADPVREQILQAYRTSSIEEKAARGTFRAARGQVLRAKDQSSVETSVAEWLLNCAALIDNNPQFCAEAQIALRPLEHGRVMYELMHLRNLILLLGTQLEAVEDGDESAVGTVLLENGKTGELQFVHSEDGWRISIPSPIDDAEAVFSGETPLQQRLWELRH